MVITIPFYGIVVIVVVIITEVVAMEPTAVKEEII